MDVASMTRQRREIVPQSEDVLEGAAIIGGVLFAHYLVDVKNEIRRYDLKGAPLGNVALPGIGSVVGFGGEQNEDRQSVVYGKSVSVRVVLGGLRFLTKKLLSIFFLLLF